MQNNSFVEVDAGSSLTVTGGGFANNSGALLNLGGSLNALGGFANNGGTVITDPGSTLITSIYSQSGGLTDVSGTLVANSYRQTGGATLIEAGGLANILGTLNNTFSYFTIDNSVLNVGGDMVTEGLSNAILENNSIGVVGGSLYNGGKGSMTIDQSLLTVRGNVLNEGFGDLLVANAATLNVLGNFTNCCAGSGALLFDGGTVNVAGTVTNGRGGGLAMGGTNDVLNARDCSRTLEASQSARWTF